MSVLISSLQKKGILDILAKYPCNNLRPFFVINDGHLQICSPPCVPKAGRGFSSSWSSGYDHERELLTPLKSVGRLKWDCLLLAR